MVLIEAADPTPAAQEGAGLACPGVAANVGGDDIVEAIEGDLDAGVGVAIAFGTAHDIGREEIVVAGDVKMAPPQVCSGDT